jgi:membrane fusion protein (multidrug efflux system)
MQMGQVPFVAVLFTACLMATACETQQEASAGPPEVEVVDVLQKDVPITKEWVATLDGLVNAQVRPQVSGLLIEQKYTDGAFVRENNPLFQIDPRPFQVSLDQANGNLSQAKANLEQSQAKLGKTELDVARYTPLAKRNAISQQELDNAIQANLAAKAEVEQSQAAIQAAQAAVDAAQLNLGFTTILSPIDGIAAIASAQVGNFVTPVGAPLTIVSTVNPVLVNFTASEQEYLNAIRAATLRGTSQEAALRSLEWQLILTDGTVYSHKGRFYALDRQVDIRTGAILVQIQFPNPGNVLRPGGFGRIRTVTNIEKGALLVPQRAVTELQGGNLVAVIGENNIVHIRPVKVGSRVEAMWIVAEGLKPGDRVVAEGVQKVRDGLQVNPKAYQDISPEPQPEQSGKSNKQDHA